MTARRRTTAKSRQRTESPPRSGDGLQRLAVNGPIKRIDVPDKVLNQLAELASIPPTLGLCPQAPKRLFTVEIMKIVVMVHDLGNILSASKLKRLKEIAYHAQELSHHLKASDKKKLFAICSDDTVEAIAGLARGAQRAARLAKAPRQGKWLTTVRKEYVEGLLDAAALAGGHLTLNRRKRGGSLMDALRLLNPYLPQQGVLQSLSTEWSFSTLRRIYDPWRARNKTVAQELEKPARKKR
jgi:hypothetical protein